MLQQSIKSLKYLFLLAIFLAVPAQVWAGIDYESDPFISATDAAGFRAVYFFDERNSRDTFVQLSNVASFSVTVHFQIFVVNADQADCLPCDFFDVYTPEDTHVYEIANIVANDGGQACNLNLEGKYGAVVISMASSGVKTLIGNGRIIDADGGYEYRYNAHLDTFRGFNQSLAFLGGQTDEYLVHFNPIQGFNNVDLVGIVYDDLFGGDDAFSTSVIMAPTLSATFGVGGDQVFQINNDEDALSCFPVTFACAVGLMDRGINPSYPNSQGQLNNACLSSTNAPGPGPEANFLFMPFDRFEDGNGDDAQFVGYIGLNNDSGLGSMDSWWATDDF